MWVGVFTEMFKKPSCKNSECSCPRVRSEVPGVSLMWNRLTWCSGVCTRGNRSRRGRKTQIGDPTTYWVFRFRCRLLHVLPHLIIETALLDGYYLHFTKRGNGTEFNLSKVTQPVKSTIGIQTQVFVILKPAPVWWMLPPIWTVCSLAKAHAEPSPWQLVPADSWTLHPSCSHSCLGASVVKEANMSRGSCWAKEKLNI